MPTFNSKIIRDLKEEARSMYRAYSEKDGLLVLHTEDDLIELVKKYMNRQAALTRAKTIEECINAITENRHGELCYFFCEEDCPIVHAESSIYKLKNLKSK